MSTNGTSSPQRYYLISYPRTASNLLVKILNLSSQQNISQGQLDGGYFFMRADDALIEQPLRSKTVSHWTPSERNEMQKCYQQCFDDMKAWLETKSAEGKSVFVKEHATFLATPEERSRLIFGDETGTTPLRVEHESNSTWSEGNRMVLPDDFLQTWLPTFLIRHPALAFPSYYRAVVKTEGSNAEASGNHYASFKMTSIKWSRQLFDLYTSWKEKLPTSKSAWPIVLDADDIISSPKTMIEYARLLDLDPEKLRFSWDAVGGNELEKMDAASQVMRSTLIQSTGIVKAKAQGMIDIGVEEGKWKEEFGTETAGLIAEMVREAMPDYEYLRARRLRVEA